MVTVNIEQYQSIQERIQVICCHLVVYTSVVYIFYTQSRASWSSWKGFLKLLIKQAFNDERKALFYNQLGHISDR